MSKIDEMLDLHMPIDKNHQRDKAAIKSAMEDFFLEIVEEAWIERGKVATHVGNYETGSRLAKRLLKKKIKESFNQELKDSGDRK